MERAGKGNRVISRLHVILIFSARRRSTRHRALRSGGGCRKITEAAALKSKKIPKLAAYIYIYIYTQQQRWLVQQENYNSSREPLAAREERLEDNALKRSGFFLPRRI